MMPATNYAERFRAKYGARRTDLEALDRATAGLSRLKLWDAWLNGDVERLPLAVQDGDEALTGRAFDYVQSGYLHNLFWKFWRPRVFSEGYSDDEVTEIEGSPGLPSDMAHEVEGTLAELELSARKAFVAVIARLEADKEDSVDPTPDEFESLDCYITCATSLALLMLRRNGYHNDFVRDLLERAVRAGEAIVNQVPYVTPRDPDQWVSPYAIYGLALLESYRMEAYAKRYEKSLSWLARAAAVLADIGNVVEADPDAIQWVEAGLADRRADDWNALQRRKRYDLVEAWEMPPLDRTDAKRAVYIVNSLMTRKRAADAPALANNCRAIAFGLPAAADPTDLDEVASEQREGRDWLSLWHSAAGYTENRMEAGDLRDHLETLSREGGDLYYRSYVFADDLWRELPSRCRESLLTLDVSWISASPEFLESAVNELTIAIESLFSAALWRPFKTWRHTAEGRAMAVATPAGCGPDDEAKILTLHQCVGLVREPLFQKFVELLPIGELTKDYVTGRKPSGRSLYLALMRLHHSRHRAEQEGVEWTNETVRVHLDEFLGLGRVGVLPTLARVKRVTNPSLGVRREAYPSA